jgi:integrase
MRSSFFPHECINYLRKLRLKSKKFYHVVSARWEDVDYEKRKIILRGTKTEGSLRSIEIFNSLYETLKGLEDY